VPAETIYAYAEMFVDFVNGFALADAGMPACAKADHATLPPTGLDVDIDVMILGLRALVAVSEPDQPQLTPATITRC
jgi:hypothetical protein